MKKIWEWLSGNVIKEVGNVIDKLTTTKEEKLELDVKYVETATVLGDIRIVLATITHVFSRKDIYEKRYSQTELTRGMNEDQESKCNV